MTMLALVLFAALLPNIEIGQNLTPPAQVAGPWESLVAPGEVAGFSLLVITNADGTVRMLRLDTYVRKNGKTTRTWWSSGAPGSLVLRSGRLSFRQAHTFDVALDMTFDPTDNAWKGSFKDPFFSGQVVLRRPDLTNSAIPAGTWRMYSNVSVGSGGRRDDYGCLNIGVGEDNALILWEESHSIFVGTATQQLYGDSFGELDNDSHAERYANEWSFNASNDLGGDRITGTLSSDGSSFGGESEHYGNGAVDPTHPRRAFAWTRMPDLTCRP